jgi:enoyl-[acyl-carrier protein] reductase II
VITTRLTELLGIDHPVMLAGMSGVSYHRLVAAVSEAGGFGCMGATTIPAEEMVEEMRATRAHTDRPWGVDLLAPMSGDFLDRVDQLIEEGATLFVAGLGIPPEAIERCHRAGVLVGSMCGKVDHARRAVDAGCDLVIAQGTEAGGHTGRIATMPLVPQVVDAVGDRVPVVAAGGIFDGRGLAASLALGADGVWVGPRFVATHEARVQAGFKERLLETTEDGTVVTTAYTGKTCRVIRNAYTDHYEQHPEQLQGFPEQAVQAFQDGVNHLGSPDAAATEIDPDREFYPAGQAAGAVGELESAGELVHRFVAEAEQVLDRVGTVRLAPS